MRTNLSFLFFLSMAVCLSRSVVAFVLLPTASNSLQSQRISCHDKIFYQSRTSSSSDNDTIDSPVLQQLYPKLLEYQQIYGHVNIPLGSKEGKQCQTLRRLHIQQKLSQRDVTLLQSLNFTFSSLEDVYLTHDFEDLYQRLERYYQTHDPMDTGPPKKYAADPELGAWVTGIRRLGKTGLTDPSHAQRLDALNFQWKSKRQCGSAFMTYYRELQERLHNSQEKEEEEEVWKDPTVQKWVRAQQEQAKKGNLSETRKHYMQRLLQTIMKTTEEHDDFNDHAWMDFVFPES